MKYNVDETFFEVIDTEAKAYFLGLMYADGYNSVDGNYFTITLKSDDIDILEKFKKCLNCDYPIRTSLRTSTHNKEPKLFSQLQISRGKMCKDLEKLGCPQAKTEIIKFPFWMRHDLLNHFVRGYFDGDGGLSKEFKVKKGYTLYRLNIVSNPTFIDQLNDICLEIFGQKFYINKYHKHKKTTQLTVSGNRLIESFCSWMYNNATIFLNRKYNIYQELLNRKYIDKKIPVFVYKKDGTFVGTFESKREAGRQLGVDSGSVIRCTQNPNKTAKGYKFYNHPVK